MFAFSLSLPLLGTTARSLPILLLHASRREIVQVVLCVRASQKMSNQQKLTGPIKKRVLVLCNFIRQQQQPNRAGDAILVLMDCHC